MPVVSPDRENSSRETTNGLGLDLVFNLVV